MNRLTSSFASALVLAGAVIAAPPNAQGADSSNMLITSYDIAYHLGADGGTDVTENLTVRFDDSSHHGFDRFIVIGQGVSSNSHRLYPISQISVAASTVAPTSLRDTTDGVVEQLRVGDPDRTVSGTQRYTVRYHLAGVVNKQANGSTAFSINTIGTHWALPIYSAHITVTGPAAITDTRCWYGEKGSTQTC